jgi:hypothetical protein
MMQMAVLYHVQERNAEARKILEEIIRDCSEKEPVEIARRHLSEYLKIGQDAPGFAEKDIEGNETSLEKLRGKVVVIYFFDPATASALAESTFLKKARGGSRPGGPRGGPADPRRLHRHRPEGHGGLQDDGARDWRLLYDGRGIDGRFARLYDVRGLPSLVVIDRKGKTRYYNIAGRDFRNSVARLIEEK